MTVTELCRWGRWALSQIPDASKDADLLLRSVLGWDEVRLLVSGDEAVPSEDEHRYRELINRRSQGEPAAYLCRTRGFWNLELEVDPAVLVPRPETELLVEQVLHLIQGLGSPRILELGTGSGAIALALANERPDSSVVATDVSPEALAVARRNQESSGLTNVQWDRGNWFDCLTGERFNLICSNPPYIPAGDPHLDGDGVRWEPRLALVSGTTGLEELETIVDGAPMHTDAGGWLVLEHGYDQGMAVRTRMARRGYSEVRTVRDLSGNDRVSLGRLSLQSNEDA